MKVGMLIWGGLQGGIEIVGEGMRGQVVCDV